MTPRYPYIPSWESQTSICDILKVFPTVGPELERLGIPPTAIHDCISVGEVARHVGWSPYALLNFLIPPSPPVPTPVSGSSISGNASISCTDIVEILKSDHVRILGGHISPIRDLWSRWEGEGYPSAFPLLPTLGEEFETFCAEISCHFLLEEEELFPYVIELQRACSAQVSHQEAIQILNGKSLTDDGEIIALVDLFEHLLSRFPQELKPLVDTSNRGDPLDGNSFETESVSEQRSDQSGHTDFPKPIDQVPKLSLRKQDLYFGNNLWNSLLALKETWIRHEARETSELFPRILELENHLPRKN